MGLDARRTDQAGFEQPSAVLVELAGLKRDLQRSDRLAETTDRSLRSTELERRLGSLVGSGAAERQCLTEMLNGRRISDTALGDASVPQHTGTLIGRRRLGQRPGEVSSSGARSPTIQCAFG